MSHRNYRSLEKWKQDAKAAGARVRLATRWVAGGGHWKAVHPRTGIIGFYNVGTSQKRTFNSGSLTIQTQRQLDNLLDHLEKSSKDGTWSNAFHRAAVDLLIFAKSR